MTASSCKINDTRSITSAIQCALSFLKKRMIVPVVGVAVLACMIVLSVSPVASAEVDNTFYADILTRFVHDGKVDYAGIARHENRLNAYLDTMAAVQPETLGRNDQLAYFINLYNAWTIKLILTEWPDIESIKDIGSLFSSPWDKKIVRLHDKTVTLDDIEHGIIRPVFGDARIHFAVNCSAVSCPPILAEPYTGERLDAQLDYAVRSFLNAPENYRFDGNTLYVTKLFDWYEEDFAPSVQQFIRRYAEGELLAGMERAGEKLRIRYLDYDWTLNNTGSRP